MIYFDNAATTFFKPPQVIDCVLDSLKNPANANRGGHSLSVAATAKITEVRNKVARMVNLSDPFNKDTRLVVLSHVSNVVGFVNDVASIGDLCRRAGVTFIVDAAQSAGYTEIDMQRMKI